MAALKERTLTQKVLNVWGIILIVWSVYRAYFKTDLPIWFDEAIAKPIVFILPVYFFITRIEKKQFLSGLDITRKKLGQNIIVGVVVGSLFLVSGMLGTFIKTHSISFGVASLSVLGSFLLYSFLTSISEEVVSRGFVLKRLYEESRNKYTSSFFASILFFFLHIPILLSNDRIVGFILIKVMITDLILSFIVSFLYLERRSLVVPILVHAFYTLSLYAFT